MVSIRTGGDPESYMEAPALSKDAGQGGSLIAMVLDLLGINRQVAKEPKEKKSKDKVGANPVPEIKTIPALDAAESVFQPMQPMDSNWGERYLNSMKPLQAIDPNSAL